MTTFKFTIISLLLINLWAGCGCICGQSMADLAKAPELSKEDLEAAVFEIGKFSKNDLTALLAAVKPDTSVEEAMLALPENLRKSIASQSPDGRLAAAARQATKLTGSKYEFVLINSPSPAAISESNCLLLVTTGIIQAAPDEDALIGVLLHEMAHGLYSRQTLAARLMFNQGVREKNCDQMFRARKDLTLIEIKCDLVAAKLMAADKMNVASYLGMLKLLEGGRNHDQVQYHPAISNRETAITLLVNTDASIAGVTKK